MIFLGVDAGIANFGLAVIDTGIHPYNLVTSACVQTSSRRPEPERLLEIQGKVQEFIASHALDCIAIEEVYHNRNVSSSSSTNRVIGVVAVSAATSSIDCVYVRPQDAKAASGFGVSASKEQVKEMMERLFRCKFSSHHVSDACAIAIAGYLQYFPSVS